MLEEIDFDAICYYLRSSDATEKDWEDVPEDIRNTFDKLGIPEAEQKWLSGVTAQYESEAVYHSIREDLEQQGVIFLDMDSGLREYPELVKEWFCSVVPYQDNKFSALNTAVWSGGSFIYVPKEFMWKCQYKHTSGSMQKIWVNLRERSLLLMKEAVSITLKDVLLQPTLPIHYIPRWSN